MCEIFKCIFRLGFAIGTGYAFGYDMVKVKYEENEYSWHVGSNLKFLSTLNLLCLCVYFCILPILNIFTMVLSESSMLMILPTHFFATVMVPMALFCTGFHWITPFIHQEYVMPSSYTNVMPKWLLHAKYTLPPFLILIEMYMSFHRYPDLMTGFALMFGWAFVYLAWLHFFQYRTGSWLYPFLQDKNARERWVFFSGLFLTLVGCYLLGELLNNNFWRQNLVLLSCNNVAGNKRCQFTQTIKV